MSKIGDNTIYCILGAPKFRLGEYEST